jgi:hypothetical protein
VLRQEINCPHAGLPLQHCYRCEVSGKGHDDGYSAVNQSFVHQHSENFITADPLVRVQGLNWREMRSLIVGKTALLLLLLRIPLNQILMGADWVPQPWVVRRG